MRDDLMRVLAAWNAKIVPHLHLCLQSGSDRILARMKRRYRSAGFLERCNWPPLKEYSALVRVCSARPQ